MWPAVHAAQDPDRPACVMAGTGEVVTYRELDERSNQVAHLFHEQGLRFGDHVAILMENNARYLEIAWAAQRSGLYYTPINYHFNAEEAAYVLDDCDARALVVSAGLADTLDELEQIMPSAVETRLVVDGEVDGYERYEDAVATLPTTPLAEELEGWAMFYSSGTTGRPKGIAHTLRREPIGNPPLLLRGFGLVYGFDEHTVYLSPAPLYHAAPLGFSMAVQRFGGTCVIMERFDAEEALHTIESYRVTHAQFVPTMFVRMLKLAPEARDRYDLSSLEVVIHAAAPCPVDVKRAMIEWWGPIINEYYGATEGLGATMISSDEWLAHPGSVGRSVTATIHVLDEHGKPVPDGTPGVVWFEPAANAVAFEYHKDPEKTASAHNRAGWASVGDIGYVDEEGYLYLTDRRDFMIVSGGVNIYPQEAENILITHPKVLDAAVFGVPDEEMGERVHAVVQPLDMSEAGSPLEQELLEFCRTHLAHYKCPKAVEFATELPRQATGKLYKKALRERYWVGHESHIV